MNTKLTNLKKLQLLHQNISREKNDAFASARAKIDIGEAGTFTMREYLTTLENFDEYYSFSDSHTVWENGHRTDLALRAAVKANPQYASLDMSSFPEWQRPELEYVTDAGVEMGKHFIYVLSLTDIKTDAELDSIAEIYTAHRSIKKLLGYIAHEKVGLVGISTMYHLKERPNNLWNLTSKETVNTAEVLVKNYLSLDVGTRAILCDALDMSEGFHRAAIRDGKEIDYDGEAYGLSLQSNFYVSLPN